VNNNYCVLVINNIPDGCFNVASESMSERRKRENTYGRGKTKTKSYDNILLSINEYSMEKLFGHRSRLRSE